MDTRQLEALISQCLQDFYKRRLGRLDQLKLKTFLRRKNPYLFRALATESASEIVEKVMTAYIGSSDETIFGDAFFEPVAPIVSGGQVSDGKGIDFIVESDKRFLAVALKSGPNIFNSSQKDKQAQEFLSVRNRLYKMHKEFDPELGHAYGRLETVPSRDKIYRDLSGQAFWAEITGDDDFYLKLIRLMKDAPLKHKKEYDPIWNAAKNRFIAEFVKDFCFPDGHIDWEKLTRFVSEKPAKA
jgi:hypothetical protein